MSNQASLKDGCPEWAQDLIVKLREVEILLGNIPNSLAWQSKHIAEVAKRAFAKEEAVFDEQKVEFIYKRIVRGLIQEKFSPAQICAFINARVGYQGGPPYTNEAEVREVMDL